MDDTHSHTHYPAQDIHSNHVPQLRSHTHTHTNTRSHTHTTPSTPPPHTHTTADTHTHTHTHTQTHAQTHTRALITFYSSTMHTLNKHRNATCQVLVSCFM